MTLDLFDLEARSVYKCSYRKTPCPRCGSSWRAAVIIPDDVMGLLDKLWDDTVAGPRPDNGLSRLRKYNTFSARTSSGKESDGGNGRSYGEDFPDESMKVTRSIMIVKAAGNPSSVSSPPPSSPAGSTPPVSPFAGGGRDPHRFRRKSASDAYSRENESKIPTPPYDV